MKHKILQLLVTRFMHKTTPERFRIYSGGSFIKTLFCFTLSFTFLPNSMAEPVLPLPDPTPFAEATALGRQEPILKSSQNQWHDYKNHKNIIAPNASFVVGNKAVVVRKQSSRGPYDIVVTIDNKIRGYLRFWGALEKGNFGYPFKDLKDYPPKLVVDEKQKTITLEKPYLTKSGEKATFSYTVHSLGSSKVEVSWTTGNDSIKVSPWFIMGKNFRSNSVAFGKTVYKPDTVDSKKKRTSVSGNISYNKNIPAKGYTVEFTEPKAQVEEGKGLCIRKKASATGKIIIDLGKAAIADINTPPPVGGIDFYKHDGTHVPISPVRNIFHNPAFNQGLHYWRWGGGGATYEPSEILRYTVEPKGKFGQYAMVINPYQTRSSSLKSMPIALDKGKTYTLSFYARTDADSGNLTAALCSAAQAGKFRGRHGTIFGDSDKPESRFELSRQWKRFSRTFTADQFGIVVLVSGRSKDKIYVDGFQLEQGGKPTKFVTAPLEGVLVTSNPDNDIVKGKPVDGKFIVYGKPGTGGRIKLSVQNIYREEVDKYNFDVKIPESGEQAFNLTVNDKKIGEGVFVLRADYNVKGFPAYTDYRRLSIMSPLDNTHATKNIFGTIVGSAFRVCRGDDLMRKFKEWGFGSTSWGVGVDNMSQTVYAGMQKKYNIENFFTTTRFTRVRDPKYKKFSMLDNYRKWKVKDLTPEFIDSMAKLAGECAYEKVKLYDSKQYNTWCFGNEEESSVIANHPDKYMKIIAAAKKGAKRADPNIQFFLTNGTSGYSKLRGYYPMEKYFKAARKTGLRFDAVTTHIYGSIDGGWLSRYDLDAMTALLLDQMKRYGYGKETPVYYTEGFNQTEIWIPEWNTAINDRYHSGKVSYDFGNREFIQAASAARIWIITLKYWPQLKSTNIWEHMPFMDYHLTPLILNKVTNTLGHHMPYVEYCCDIKPNAKIRGYVFKLKDGSAIAPLWCADKDVDQGLTRGPKIKVRFKQPVEFYDIMGNRRSASPDKDGITKIQLTPAPLLIKAKNVKELAKAFQNIEVDDTLSNYVVKFEPTLSGKINANIKNMTNRTQTGKLIVADKTLDFKIKPEGRDIMPVPEQQVTPAFGKMFRWAQNYTLKPSIGSPARCDWNMDYFYVPKVNGTPDWNKIPAIDITNHRYNRKLKHQMEKGLKLPKDDLSASFKMAWDKDNLYLRVEAEDDDFVVSKDFWTKRPKSETMLYHHDGCLEVYFDTGANGRIGKKYDDDDYRYDFSIGRSGKSGKGSVYRFREVDHQLADGINMPSKKEASEKIKCDFQITEKGYVYTITFALRYIEPIALRKGFISGIGLYLHDKDGKDEWPPKGLTTSTQQGKHCDYNPHLWPLMILAE